MNRSNSIVNGIKWWPTSSAKLQFGSSVAIQKLRESKWFEIEEERIFCAVVECGFIVEIKENQENESIWGVVLCKSSKGGVVFFNLFIFRNFIVNS